MKALTREDVGIAATIYRLNLVPAAILAFILFSEPPTPARLAAIAAGAGAVLLFARPTGRHPASGVFSRSIMLVVLASLLRAGMGLGYKAGLLGGANEFGLLAFNGLAWITGGLAYHFAFDQKMSRFPRSLAAYGGVSGMLVCGIVLFMVLALKKGDASIVLPVTQMSFALTAAAGIVFMKEPLTARKCLGVGLGIACILLMGLNRQ